MSAAAINDRRMRAIEAGWDQTVGWSQESTGNAMEAAVQVATQVKITEDIIEAAQQAFPIFKGIDEGRVLLAAAFAAAGFEVVE